MSKAEELKKLKELLDDGAITQSEFEKEKNNILNSEEIEEKKFQEELKEEEEAAKKDAWKTWVYLLLFAGAHVGLSVPKNIKWINILNLKS